MTPDQPTPDPLSPAGHPFQAQAEPRSQASVRPIRGRLDALRSWHWGLIALAVALFIVISGLLARFFATENVERDDILAVLHAEVVGDERGMLTQLSGCATKPKCVAVVKTDAASLRRTGSVKILDLTSETDHSLTSATSPTRVAWTVIGHLPTVQCVAVKRTGNFLTGISVALLSIGKPINSEADC